MADLETELVRMKRKKELSHSVYIADLRVFGNFLYLSRGFSGFPFFISDNFRLRLFIGSILVGCL